MESSGFDAVAGPEARALILGTLPGAMSLAKRQYYAQPHNAFWSIMGEVAGAGLSLPYEERLGRLVARRLALWDVCAGAVRGGSLDSAIRAKSVRANDFDGFLESHPELQLVCFNGVKAGVLFERIVLPTLGAHWDVVQRITLPSTSSANASIPLRAKIHAWRTALATIDASHGLQPSARRGC